MTSKYQKKPLFNKEKMLKMKEFTVEDNNGHKQFVNYSELKLSIISNQLCFVTPDDYFMPIARVTTINDIIGKENSDKRFFEAHGFGFENDEILSMTEED